VTAITTWADLFERAAAAGVSDDDVRAAVAAIRDRDADSDADADGRR
jgi:hypothetical protein